MAVSTLCGHKRFLEAVTPAVETPQFVVDGEMFWGKDRMPSARGVDQDRGLVAVLRLNAALLDS
jgi:hypothetical protein